MATRYIPDRFDTLPDGIDRVGAHRAPAKSGRGWIGFAWAALATGVLVGAGILGLSLFTDSINLPFADTVGGDVAEPLPEETVPVPEPVAPVQNPDVSITVLNGTTTTGLANTVGDTLVAGGWCGATGVNEVVDGPCVGRSSEGSRANAATQDIAATVVYYRDAIDESAARALVESLGVGEVQLSAVYPESPITVVIGADYTVPIG